MGDVVDDDAFAPADPARETLRRNVLLERHQAVVALGLDRLGHVRGEIVGGRPADRLVTETADAIELGFPEPIEQQREILFRLAGKADDEGRAQREARAGRAPCFDAFERLFLRRRPPHALEHRGTGVLERDVEVGEHLAVGHQADDLVDVRVGIDVMQPHPDAEFAERAGKIDEFGAHFAVLPGARHVFRSTP